MPYVESWKTNGFVSAVLHHSNITNSVGHDILIM